MMKIALISAVILGTVSITLCLATICNSANSEVDKLIKEERIVELDGAKSVRVNLDSANADIQLRGGSEKLLDGRFTYSLAEWKPELHYEVNQRMGELTLRQPSQKNTVHGKTRNEWDISLNGSVPLDMSVKSASGDCAFDLSKLCVTRLKASMASGDIRLGIADDHHQLSALDIQTASGDIAATLKGHYSSLANANLASASGNIALDISGDWAKDAAIHITTASGDVTVKLPSKIGVRVLTHTISGDVNAPGLNTVDGARVNSAYGHTKMTLNVSIESASGDINLRVLND